MVITRAHLCEHGCLWVADNYHKWFSSHVKYEVDVVKNKTNAKRNNILIEEVDEEIIHWVPNTRFIRIKDTKFFKTTELY